jgi:hypothetical protein
LASARAAGWQYALHGIEAGPDVEGCQVEFRRLGLKVANPMMVRYDKIKIFFKGLVREGIVLKLGAQIWPMREMMRVLRQNRAEHQNSGFALLLFLFWNS